MSIAITIFVVVVLLVAGVLHLGGHLMFLVALVIGIFVGISALARLTERDRIQNRPHGPRRTPDGLECPNAKCGRLNPHHARFCGQCGRPLR